MVNRRCFGSSVSLFSPQLPLMEDRKSDRPPLLTMDGNGDIRTVGAVIVDIVQLTKEKLRESEKGEHRMTNGIKKRDSNPL